MTIASETRSVNYPGDDSYPDPKDFAFTFKILEDSDLQVTLTDANGAATVLTLSTHYTVAGAGADTGGTVTMVTAPNDDEVLTIEVIPSITQSLNLKTNANFPPESIEAALDKLTMICLYLQAAFVIPANLSATEYTSGGLPAASATYANTFVIVNDPATAAQVQVCLETSTDGVYEWVVVALAGV